MAKVNYSDSVNKLPPYLFAEMDRKKKELIAKGVDIISFGVGDPDLPTPGFIIEAMKKALHNPKNHQYPFGKGMDIFIKTIAQWYKKRFDIDLNESSEIHSLLGSKEGIGHFPLAFINPGDIVLCPEPGYPVYSSGTIFARGVPYYMPLLEKNRFIPDIDAIPHDIAEKAKIMFINYPNNPTAAACIEQDFKKVIDFARKYNIIVAHDAAYTEIYYNNKKPISFLNVQGAKDVGVEFHSLSKTFNMTGWRVGFVVGNEHIIKGISVVKDNYDSGVFGAIQEAAIVALQKGDEESEKLRGVYQKRRDFFIKGMKSLGWNMTIPEATFYIWTKIPDGYTSQQCSEKFLDESGIVVTPGNGFGPSGEGYIRFALTVNEQRMQEAIDRIKKMNW